MTNFRKCWDDEKNNWLLSHSSWDAAKAYADFVRDYPDTDISFIAFKNQRSRIGAVKKHSTHGTTRARPLFSESKKNGYVYIKIGQPSIWMLKGRYVYETTRNVKLKKNEVIIFLNGDSNDFTPENLYAINSGGLAVINGCFGGIKKNDVENTMLKIKQAELHRLMIKKAREFGLCNSTGRLKSVENKRTRKRREKNKKEIDRRAYESFKRKMEWLKNNNPEEYKRRKEKMNKYKREYARKRRERLKNGI